MRYGRYPYPLSSWAMAAVVRTAIAGAENLDDGNPGQDEKDIQKYVNDIPHHLTDRYMEVAEVLTAEFKKQHLLHKIVHPACTRVQISSSGDQQVDATTLRCLPRLGNKTREFSALLDSNYEKLGEDDDYNNDVNSALYISDIASELPVLENLTVIKIPYLCTAELLDAISRKCPALTELDISNCKFYPGEILCLVYCHNLQVLQCSYNTTEDEDIADLIKGLSNLRALPNYNLSSVIDYLDFLDNKYEEYSGEYALELACFTMGREADFQKLCLLFPNLKEIYEIAILPQSYITSLKGLTNLHTVSFASVVRVPQLLDLFDGIADRFRRLIFTRILNINELFFTTTFESLERLYLESCDDIDILLINQSAPNLMEVMFSSCSAKPFENITNEKGFVFLRHLCLDGLFSVEHLEFLLGSCPDLQYLELHNVIGTSVFNDEPSEIITDQFVTTVLNNCEKEDLESICITSNKITTLSINFLLDSFPKLKRLYLEGSQWKNQFKRKKSNEITNRLVHSFPLATKIISNEKSVLNIYSKSVEEEENIVENWKSELGGVLSFYD